MVKVRATFPYQNNQKIKIKKKLKKAPKKPAQIQKLKTHTAWHNIASEYAVHPNLSSSWAPLNSLGCCYDIFWALFSLLQIIFVCFKAMAVKKHYTHVPTFS